MSNRDRIEKAVIALGYEIGCYSSLMDKLSQVALKKVLAEIEQDYSDVFINIDRKLHIVEIATVDNEKDFTVWSAIEYFSNYGNLEDALDNGNITERQYQQIKSCI
jgi:hypothetical protein